MRRVFGVIPSVTLIVAAACGGSQPTSGSAAPTAAATATAAGTAAATAAATAGATAAAGPSLTDILKAGKLASYKVTYKWTVTGGGQSIDSTQTWYYKPPKARFDYSLGAAAGGATFSIFVLEDGTYLCTNAAGAAFCQKTTQQAAFQQNPAADFDLQVLGKPDQFNATFQGSRTIAGQQAQCYGIKASAGTFGDVTSCYSATGVPLLTQMTSQGSSFSMEATAFSATVADSDFQLPGPVR